MGPGPPPGAAIRSSTPKVRSSCQPVESSGANIGMAEFRTASAAKAAPVVDKKAIKHVKLNLDMFPLRTELRFLTRINLLRRRFNQPRRGSALFKKPRSRSGGRSSRKLESKLNDWSAGYPINRVPQDNDRLLRCIILSGRESAVGHNRERRPHRRPASHAAGVPQLADSLLAGREGSALGQLRP